MKTVYLDLFTITTQGFRFLSASGFCCEITLRAFKIYSKYFVHYIYAGKICTAVAKQ